ncbi:hypothetical protein GCM10022402_39540 [Salinactinospora qingdaonensis]|uniref:Recombinase domain-containing protein n=2 Tax=Salinactinospora qingdaonensis TaxID=702744 RepID=A0ABP7G6M8_9ACTN
MSVPVPRDGGITDLLEEAARSDRRFDAVICESIDRIARRTYLGTQIEYRLEQLGVMLFASDEPIVASGKRASQILTRRVKQGVAEWYVLELLEKSWDGFETHTEQGFNIGRAPYGYTALRVPHPVPARRAEGASKHRLTPDPVRAPVVSHIYELRVRRRLGYAAIAELLNLQPERFPPPEPVDAQRRVGRWTASSVRGVLTNPKYTGYMVWNRRATKTGRGRHNAPTGGCGPVDSPDGGSAPAAGGRLAARLPQVETEAHREHEAGLASLQRRLHDLDTRRERLLAQLEVFDDPHAEMAADIRARAQRIYEERGTVQEQLRELQQHAPQRSAPELLEALPVGERDLAAVPEELLRRLFEAFRLQVVYDRPRHAVTVRVHLAAETVPELRQAADRVLTHDDHREEPQEREDPMDAATPRVPLCDVPPAGDRTAGNAYQYAGQRADQHVDHAPPQSGRTGRGSQRGHRGQLVIEDHIELPPAGRGVRRSETQGR